MAEVVARWKQFIENQPADGPLSSVTLASWDRSKAAGVERDLYEMAWRDHVEFLRGMEWLRFDEFGLCCRKPQQHFLGLAVVHHRYTKTVAEIATRIECCTAFV